MREIDVQRLDLNLLKVFVALFEESSVTAAADRLGVAQSSMSHALARLRIALDDHLFVRTTSGMLPTPYAVTLIDPVRRVLVDLQRALEQGAAFDSRASDRSFTLIITDVVGMILLPRLMANLARTAPHVQIIGIQLPRSEYREALESGRADLAIGQLPSGHTDFYQQSLLEQPFACFVREGHPLTLVDPLDFDSLMKAHHLVVSPPAMAELHVKKALGARAARRRIALHVPHYMVAPFVLISTDLVAVLPTTLQEFFLSLGSIVRLPIPFEIEPIITRQFWHERVHADLGCQWLRQTIAEVFIGDPSMAML